jgi:hypothetical protein
MNAYHFGVCGRKAIIKPKPNKRAQCAEPITTKHLQHDQKSNQESLAPVESSIEKHRCEQLVAKKAMGMVRILFSSETFTNIYIVTNYDKEKKLKQQK